MVKREYTATSYVIHEEKILLIFHKKFNKWLPPGGHIEENETADEAALREVKEETGLDVELILQENIWIPTSNPNAHSLPRPYLCLIEQIPAYKDVPAHQHVDFIFLSKPKAEARISTQETHTVRWFSQEEVLELPTDTIFPDTIQILSHIFSNLSLNTLHPV